MQDTFARAPTWPSARATIGYLVYKGNKKSAIVNFNWVGNITPAHQKMRAFLLLFVVRTSARFFMVTTVHICKVIF